MKNVIRLSRRKGKTEISCIVTYMGKDISVSIFGGDIPHIGSVVLAEPRPSLTGKGQSVTSSVINRLGHKDEVIARDVADALAKKYGVAVLCACGIHIHHADQQDLKQIRELVEELKMDLYSKYPPDNNIIPMNGGKRL